MAARKRRPRDATQGVRQLAGACRGRAPGAARGRLVVELNATEASELGEALQAVVG